MGKIPGFRVLFAYMKFLMFTPLPEGPFTTIVADPPWIYSYATRRTEKPGTGWRGAGENHYQTLSMATIKSLPVESIAAKDAVCWLWVVNPMLTRCVDVLAAWGFDYRGMLTWCKTSKSDDKKPFIGNGYWLRGATEHAVFGVRGKPPKPSCVLPTWIASPPQGHSVKPQKAFDVFENFANGPRVELFARKPRSGWVCWGNEIISIKP